LQIQCILPLNIHLLKKSRVISLALGLMIQILIRAKKRSQSSKLDQVQGWTLDFRKDNYFNKILAHINHPTNLRGHRHQNGHLGLKQEKVWLIEIIKFSQEQAHMNLDLKLQMDPNMACLSNFARKRKLHQWRIIQDQGYMICKIKIIAIWEKDNNTRLEVQAGGMLSLKVLRLFLVQETMRVVCLIKNKLQGSGLEPVEEKLWIQQWRCRDQVNMLQNKWLEMKVILILCMQNLLINQLNKLVDILQDRVFMKLICKIKKLHQNIN